MRILIIDEEFPFPLDTGKKIRSYNLAKALSSRHHITYLAYGENNSIASDFLLSNGIEPAAVRPHGRKKKGWAFLFRLIFNLFSRYPYIVTSHFTAMYRDKLNILAASGDYDIIICEWTPYAIYIKNIVNTKKIIVAHNIESQIWKRYEANETNWAKKMYITHQRIKVENFEQICFSWADGATAVSESEKDFINRLPINYRAEVIDNGVDTGYFKPAKSETESRMVVFTGSMDWRPNQDAAVFFVNEILPRVKSRIPEITAYFVGRNPPQHIKALEKAGGVKITGTVDDVRPYIARAGLYIVPLRIGGGSRLKILEALAMEKAVISTSVGAEGLKVTDGENIIIADGPESFAGAIIENLKNDEYCRQIGRAGKKLVEIHYRWESLGMKLNAYIEKIISKK